MYCDCLVHDDDALALLAKRTGVDRIMVGTDFQQGDILGGAVRWIRESNLFSEDEKQKILWRNAKTFIGARRTRLLNGSGPNSP
jgi:predicted TIM-barrel fold metal-dependent hydrolase